MRVPDADQRTASGPRRTDRARRRIAAPADRLFDAWTDPDLLVRWLPPHGMTARVDQLDVRPGGGFRLVLAYDDAAVAGKSGGNEDSLAARFVAVDPPRHLAFVSTFDSDDPAFQGEMRMDWHFDAEGDATRVRVIASDVPPGISAEDHAEGMTASLDQLAALVE